MIQRLRERPREFAFFQAVRLLELAKPGSVHLGRAGPAEREAVRLRPSSSLAFQAGEITRFEERPSGDRLTTTVMGLYGANSPLPAFYSTDILEYETQHGGDEDPVRAFLDLLNHRLLSLLFRAWSKYRWAFTFELGAVDDISRAVLALAGIGDPVLRDELRVPPQRLLRYAGLITQVPTSAQTLRCLVSDYFDDAPTRISECVARWVRIHRLDQSRLGTNNATLGGDLVLGETVLDQGSGFRIELGPLPDLEAFEHFTPEGAHWHDLGGLIEFLLTDPLEYDLRLGLEAEAVPMLKLSSDAPVVRLGRTSWLSSQPPEETKWEVFRTPELRAAA